MSERYLYLASFGWALLVAYVVCQVQSAKFKIKSLGIAVRVIGVIGFVAILTFYSVRTVLRNRDWSDNYTFWTKELSNYPDSVLASHNLGNSYYDRGDLKKAIQLYERAESKNTRNVSVVNLHLANVYLKDGQMEKALVQFAKAIEKDKKEHLAYYGLGYIYSQQEKLDLAVEAYTKTLDLNPLYYPAYIDLGAILVSTGRLDRAIEKFTIASKIEPKEALPHRNLAAVYMKQNKYDLAIIEYQIALKLDPNNAEFKESLQKAVIMRNIKSNQNQQKETEN